MSEQIKYYDKGFNEHAASRGVNTERRTPQRVVIFGTEALTSLGDMDQTFEGFLEGKSGVKTMPEVENWRTNIGAPVEFNPTDHFTRSELKRMDDITALATKLTRDLVKKVDLVAGDGKLPSNLRTRFGIHIGSGIGPVLRLVGVSQAIEAGRNKETGEPSRLQGSKLIDMNEGLKIFPQDISGRPAMEIGAQGESGNTAGACNTGAMKVTNLYDSIHEGRLDAGIAGGIEYGLNTHPDILVGIFAQLKVISARNDEPEKASRPFAVGRDGFVPASGAAIVGMGSEKFCRAYGLPILGEVYHAYNSVDGGHPTNMDIDNVTRTLLQASYDEENDAYFAIDLMIAHGTSTPVGDPNEAEMLRRAYGDNLKDIFITGNKGNIGHTIAGAGAVNIAEAVEILKRDVIPPIANLEEVDPEVADLQFVRGEPLNKKVSLIGTTAFGFGGYNSAVIVGRHR